jgi:hypothetical protein
MPQTATPSFCPSCRRCLHTPCERLRFGFVDIKKQLLAIAGIFVAVNYLVDALYAWLDPRVRYG